MSDGNISIVKTPDNKTYEVKDAVARSDIQTLQNVVSKTANGLAPQLPDETTTTKYLRQDGTWAIPQVTTVTGTLPVSRGGTGATSAANAANKLYVYTLVSGTNIAANKDLNTLVSAGNYHCTSDATAQSLPNRPEGLDRAFTMKMGYANGSNSYIYQEITTYDTGKRWYRMYTVSSTTWTDWVEYGPDTHWTTHLYVGKGTTTNEATTDNEDTKISVSDNTSIRDSVTLQGSGATRVTSDANKVITIDSTDTTYTFATGSTNGAFSVTPSGGSAQNVSIKGLSTMAYESKDNYKPKQTAVSDPTASGNTLSFIDSISQDANGVITVTKKTVTTANSSAGILSNAAQTIAGAKTFTSSATVSTSGTSDIGFFANNSNKSHKVGLIIGGSSGNGGLWDSTKSKWIVYSDTSGNVVLNGNANTATSATSAGTATTATKFSSTRSITLSGDITGTASSDGTNGWSITTSISDAASLRSKLGLSSALRFIGIAVNTITDGGTEDPGITNYSNKTTGDVIIDSSSQLEYVWTGDKWERLGLDDSYLLNTGGEISGDLSVSGTLTLTRTQDLSGTSNKKPALIVGGAATAAHIEIDSDEIQAKTNGTSVAALSINADGGQVNIGNNGVNINGGTITATTFSGTATLASQVAQTELTNQNLNDYKDAVGFYFGSGGNTVTNGPTGVSGGFGVMVLKSASSYRHQIVVTKDDKIHSRFWNNSAWSSWKEWKLTDTNTWRDVQDNLTSSTNTTDSLSAKQGYLLANGSARDSTKLPLDGGTMNGTITRSVVGGNWISTKDTSKAFIQITGETNTSRFDPIMAGKNDSGHTWVFGRIQKSLKLVGIYADRTENNIDWDININVDTGNVSFSGTVTAPTFSGNATTATTASRVSGTNATSDAARHVWFSHANTETQRCYDDDFKYNPSTNTLTVANVSGNASTATSATELSHYTTIASLDALNSTGELSYVTFSKLSKLTGHSGEEGPENNDGIVLSMPWSDTYSHQIYFDDNSYQIKHRYRDTNGWKDWKNIIDSNNYTTYTVTKSGTGASGTWGISISGNANTATTATTASTANSVDWSGVQNIPITLYANAALSNSGAWQTLGGMTSGQKISVAKNNGTPANWNSGAYSTMIMFGASDVKGLLDIHYNTPYVTFAGGSTSGSTNNAPKWYFKLTGTTATSYNLDNFFLKTGGTINGNITMQAVDQGIYFVDSTGTTYASIFDNGANLWIGAEEATATHHTGQTLISSGVNSSGVGNNTIQVAIPTRGENNTWSVQQGAVLHSLNYTDYTLNKDNILKYINSNDVETYTAEKLASETSIAIIRGNVADAPSTGHWVWFNAFNIGTKFQLLVHDSSNLYFYKRWYTSGAWSEWSKMSAGYADSAGALTGFKATSTTNIGIATTDVNQAIGYVSGLTKAAWNNQQTDGALYRQVYSASQMHQIYGDYRSGHIALRGRNGGAWGNWLIVLDEGNWSSFVTKSALGIDNVENKSSATIRGEITSSNVTTALGYTPATTNVVSKTANGLAPKLPNETTTTKYLRQDGTWAVPPNDNTWTPMTGATSSANGTVGYVNAAPPKDGYNTKYLRADGTWAVPPNDNTHNTAYIYAGTSSGSANAATTNGNTYLIIKDGTSVSSRVKIGSDGATTVTSDANGNITISSTNTTALTSMTGTLAIDHGGTGATTADGARTNLGLGNVVTYNVATSGTTDTWGLVPIIGGSDGVMEVGKYIDFHTTDGNTANYDARITASTNGLTLSGTTSGSFSGNLSGTNISASGYVTVNSGNSGTAGGLALYSTSPTNYGIAMRNTSNGGKHGDVSGDWAIYSYMYGAASTISKRGWILRNAFNSVNVASVSCEGNAAFNGSVSIGTTGTTLDGSCSINLNSATNSLDFIWN